MTFSKQIAPPHGIEGQGSSVRFKCKWLIVWQYCLWLKIRKTFSKDAIFFKLNIENSFEYFVLILLWVCFGKCYFIFGIPMCNEFMNIQ